MAQAQAQAQAQDQDQDQASGRVPTRGAAPSSGFVTSLVGGFLLFAAWAHATPPPLFRDAAAELGINFKHDAGMHGGYYFVEIMGPGAALFDYDLDGDVDLWLGQGFAPESDNAGGAMDRLLRNQGGKSLLDVTEASGLRGTGYAMGAATGDVDRDGDLDLLVTQWGGNDLWRNNGDGTFTKAGDAALPREDAWSASAALVDLTGDRLPELYYTNYANYDLKRHKECFAPSGMRDYCGPGAYAADPDRLLRNRGGGRFEDFGLAIPAAPGLGVAAADFSGDGRMDLFVANDQGDNFLFIAQAGGSLVDDGLLAGVAVNGRGATESSMGVAVADFDDDGDFDIFVSHLRSETNTLYRNLGEGLFEDATDVLGLASPSWPYTGFGTVFADFDLDGNLDLFVTNGDVRRGPQQAARDAQAAFAQPDQLFLGNGRGGFVDASGRIPPATNPGIGRGLAMGDIDNDGDPDLVIANTNGRPRILLADAPEDARWIGLSLLDAETGGTAMGAVASLTLDDGRTLTRHAHTDGSYLSASDPRVRFGIPRGRKPRALAIRWPDGARSEPPIPPLNRYSELRQPGTFEALSLNSSSESNPASRRATSPMPRFSSW